MVVLNALLVPAHAVDGNGLFAVRQELRRGRQVRQDEQGDDPPEQADCPKDDKDVHPTRQSRRDMADRVANKPAKHGRQAIGAVVALQSERLLGIRVPDGHDQHKRRVDGGLGDA